MMQTRRRFLTTVSMAGAAVLSCVRRRRRRRRVRSKRRPCGCCTSPAICAAPQYVAEELLRAEGFTDIRYDRNRHRARRSMTRSSTAEADFDAAFRSAMGRRRSTRGDPITVLAGVHVGCFELFGKERYPQHHRPQRQERRSDRAGVEPPYVGVRDGRPRRARPGQGHPLDRQPTLDQADRFVRGRQDRRVSGFSPGGPGSARPAHRPRRRQQRVDRPWSQYFCCMVGGQPATRCGSTRSRPSGSAGVSQGDRSLRHRPAAASRDSLSIGGFTPRYDYALQTLKRAALRQMAGIRSRGHDQVLRSAPARSRPDQVRARTRSSPRAPIGVS